MTIRFTIPDKIALFFFALVSAIFLPMSTGIAVFVLLLSLRFLIPSLHSFDRPAERRFWKTLSYFFLVGIIMTILNGIFLKEGEILFRLFSLDLHSGGLSFGLSAAVRLIIISTGLLIFFTSTRFSVFANFLGSAGLSANMVLTLLLTLHFFEKLPHRIEQIFTAQEARGAPIRKNILNRLRSFPSILTPLIFSSIGESIDRGIALELRGFHKKPTAIKDSFPDSNLSIIGKGVIAISFITILAVIFRWV